MIDFLTLLIFIYQTESLNTFFCSNPKLVKFFICSLFPFAVKYLIDNKNTFMYEVPINKLRVSDIHSKPQIAKGLSL